eukprot:g71500.t1
MKPNLRDGNELLDFRDVLPHVKNASVHPFSSNENARPSSSLESHRRAMFAVLPTNLLVFPSTNCLPTRSIIFSSNTKRNPTPTASDRREKTCAETIRPLLVNEPAQVCSSWVLGGISSIGDIQCVFDLYKEKCSVEEKGNRLHAKPCP